MKAPWEAIPLLTLADGSGYAEVVTLYLIEHPNVLRDMIGRGRPDCDTASTRKRANCAVDLSGWVIDGASCRLFNEPA